MTGGGDRLTARAGEGVAERPLLRRIWNRAAGPVALAFVVTVACFGAGDLSAQSRPEPPPLEGSTFRPALPGWVFQFPRDHGSHDDFRTEWWYFTGHLQRAQGPPVGFELTFFRVGIDRQPGASAWDLRDVALAHFAITDERAKTFRYYEKLARQTRFTAGAATGRMAVSNEGWSAVMRPDGTIRLIAAGGGDSIDLVIRSEKAPAIHGENGVSIKAEGIGYASHYYSLTRLRGEGTLRLAGGAPQKVRATAWMDHEFGSSGLREEQAGWDWFSVQLDNNTELMLYQIRRSDGSADVTSSGSFVLQNGEVIHLRRDQFRIVPRDRWTSSRSRATYPMGWRLEVPPLKLSLELRETMREQELITTRSTGITYWEGSVIVTGSFAGTPVRGRGYVEMTGYAE